MGEAPAREAALLAGGFATICRMPSTKPSPDNAAQIELPFREARKTNLPNVYPVGAIAKSGMATRRSPERHL